MTNHQNTTLPNASKKRVVVALSGGVDSAVSALLLQQQGYEVLGAFMKCWDGNEDGCTVEEDEYWARQVASHLNIPFYRFNLVEEYKKKVVENFIQTYEAMQTPNPDVLCNSFIKFGVFYDTVMSAFNPDYIATGHYAQIQSKDGEYYICKGFDSTKDQSYFLYKINKDVLPRVLFPVGEKKKSEVRHIAEKYNLPNATKKDSQGICFIGAINVQDFLQQHIVSQEGSVVTQDGRVVGQHKGLAFYTLGQRKGVGSFGGGVPYFVIDKKPDTNELVVGTRYNPQMFTSVCLIDVCNVFVTPTEDKMYTASVRYRQQPQKVRVKQRGDGEYQLIFEELQRAITPGQSAVIYDNEVMVGGGIIQ